MTKDGFIFASAVMGIFCVGAAFIVGSTILLGGWGLVLAGVGLFFLLAWGHS